MPSGPLIVPGRVAGTGIEGNYRSLAARPRPAPVLRQDLLSGGGDTITHLARIGHLTDLHLTDTGTPVRLDFAMRVGAGRPAWRGLVDWVFRPQELLGVHAAHATVRRLAELELDLAVLTGDNIDNSQHNELLAYLSLLDGGTVDLVPGGRYQGPQDPGFADSWYWQPEPVPDEYKRRWGFPSHPGLVQHATTTPVASAGLGHPWLACAGNHDLLVGGSCPHREMLTDLVIGGRKPTALPVTLPADPLTAFLTEPRMLFAGPSRLMRPEPARRFIAPEEFVTAHLDLTRARPAGHGFTEPGRAYYRYDVTERLTVLMLGTDNLNGHWDGSLDAEQFAWLRSELAGLHGPDAPYVILASHHASLSLDNRFGVCPDHPGQRMYARQLVDLALGCPRVILWLNGHHHANRITAHSRLGGGFYEITTASVVDWPSQARLVDIFVESDRTIQVRTTMVDHHGPVNLVDPDQEWYLAGLHRELAYNDSVRAGRDGATGAAADRDAVLRIPVA